MAYLGHRWSIIMHIFDINSAKKFDSSMVAILLWNTRSQIVENMWLQWSFCGILHSKSRSVNKNMYDNCSVHLEMCLPPVICSKYDEKVENSCTTYLSDNEALDGLDNFALTSWLIITVATADESVILMYQVYLFLSKTMHHCICQTIE